MSKPICYINHTICSEQCPNFVYCYYEADIIGEDEEWNGELPIVQL